MTVPVSLAMFYSPQSFLFNHTKTSTSLVCFNLFLSIEIAATAELILHLLLVYGIYGELISQPSTFPTALVTSPFVTPQFLNDFYEVSEYTTNKTYSWKSQVHSFSLLSL